MGKSPNQFERKELLPEPGGPPDLEQFPHRDGDEGSVGAELGGGNRLLEGDAMENGTAAEVDEEAAGVLVDGQEEDAVGGGGDAGNVGGRLEWEGCGLRLQEVGHGDAIADGGDQEGVVGDDGVSAAVRRAEEVLEAVVHGG